MTGLWNLTKRNFKLFFKDKGMFFSAMITPLILLGLYAAFLANVYRDSFASGIPENFSVDESLINGIVGGQLISSLLAASCVTVAFCCNLIMVQDRVTGAVRDLTVTPVRKSTLALAYFFGTLICTVIVCFAAFGVCMIYLAATDAWYFSFGDIMLILLNILLLSFFGTVFSSIINVFLTTQGQMSAIGTIVSAGYGFLCGAYMPLASFSDGLRNVISCLPGTYGTCLIRNAVMNGVYEEIPKAGFPAEVVDKIRDSIDCNFYFFGKKLEISTLYVIFIASILVLLGIYILLNFLRKNERRK